MDSETLKSLAWILFFGAAFLLMLRFGCGAHIMGGHRHHGGHRGNEGPAGGASTRDPVCGMEVDAAKATAASVHAGQTYYFCSTTCRDKFEQAPERYAVASDAGGMQPGRRRHG